METKIAFDQVSLLYEHLVEIGEKKQIDVFLYSPGGLTLSGFAIVNLLREFCKHLTVLVPYKALSCATLISLGANEIVMGKLGQLSPVDPTVTSPYNPPAPAPAQAGVLNLLPLSVEDVSGYLNLARDEFGLKQEESMLRVLEKLAEKVHPVALGSVQRSRQQIGMLAKTLMLSHWPSKNRSRIDKAVETLTRKLGSHDYIISRREARDVLKLPVVYPDPAFEALMWRLFKKYQQAMELAIPYNADAILRDAETGEVHLKRAFLESTALTHTYETHRRLRRIQVNQMGVLMPAVHEQTLDESWKEYRDAPANLEAEAQPQP